MECEKLKLETFPGEFDKTATTLPKKNKITDTKFVDKIGFDYYFKTNKCNRKKKIEMLIRIALEIYVNYK